jgi:hypothetical protein
MSGWLLEGLYGFITGYSCESKVGTVCQHTADSLHVGVWVDVIIIDFSKIFDLVPHDTFLMKIAATVDLRVVVCVKEFLVGGAQQSEEVRVTSGVPQKVYNVLYKF